MSYARFSDGDVYVFTSSRGIECCGCGLQKRRWVNVPERIFGGYAEAVPPIVETTFRSNAGMIAHLDLHREAGHDVPEYAYERLRDPQDEIENQRIWAEDGA